MEYHESLNDLTNIWYYILISFLSFGVHFCHSLGAYACWILAVAIALTKHSYMRIRGKLKLQFLNSAEEKEWLQSVEKNQMIALGVCELLCCLLIATPILFCNVLHEFFEYNARNLVHWVRIDLCQAVMNLRYDVCAEYYQKSVAQQGYTTLIWFIVLVKFCCCCAVIFFVCRTIQKRKKLLQAQYLYETAYYLENCDVLDTKKKLLNVQRKGGSILVARQRKTGQNIPSLPALIQKESTMPTLVLQTITSKNKQKKTYWFPQLHLAVFDKRT